MSGVTLADDFSLCLPITAGDNVLWIHSIPVSKDVYKRFFLILAKAFSVMHAESVNSIVGPRIATYLLEDVAEKAGQLETVRNGFIAEIRRITTVCALTDQGWQQFPIDIAEKRKMIDEEVSQEAISAAIFFTLNWHGMPKNYREPMIAATAGMHEWQVLRSSLMEFLNSLPTSMQAAPITEMPH